VLSVMQPAITPAKVRPIVPGTVADIPTFRSSGVSPSLPGIVCQVKSHLSYAVV
jgi:hypothetical protein